MKITDRKGNIIFWWVDEIWDLTYTFKEYAVQALFDEPQPDSYDGDNCNNVHLYYYTSLDNVNIFIKENIKVLPNEKRIVSPYLGACVYGIKYEQ